MITDAWHDSTATAYHTTVPWLSGRYVGIGMLGLLRLYNSLVLFSLQYSEDSGHFYSVQNRAQYSPDTREVVAHGK